MLGKTGLYMHHAIYYHGTWDPVTTTRHVLSLWMERHGRLPQIHWTSSCGWLTQSGLQAWEFGKGCNNSSSHKPSILWNAEMLQDVSPLHTLYYTTSWLSHCTAAVKSACSWWLDLPVVDCVWNVMAHAQKPDFVFQWNGRVHLNRLRASVQSTTGSRGVRISGRNAGYTMFRGSAKGTGYPLQSPVSPSLPLPCVTVCHHISTGV